MTPQETRFPFFSTLLAGIATGTAAWLGMEHWPEGLMAQKAAAVAITLVFVFAGAFLFTARTRRSAANWVLAAGIAVVIGLSAVWLIANTFKPEGGSYEGSSGLVTSWWVTIVPLLFALLPFVQCDFQKNQSFMSDIPNVELYRKYWENLFILAFAGLLVGIYWLVAMLGVSLFDILGIRGPGRFVESPPVGWTASAVIFALGISLGCRYPNLLNMLSGLIATVCRAILPPVAAFMIAFAVTLPIVGLEMIWSTGRSTPMLLAMILVAVVSLNGAALCDGDRNPYPQWLRAGIYVLVGLLPIFALLAGYSLYQRIEQYGLTPDRYYSALFVVFALALTLSYSVIFLAKRTSWRAMLNSVNTPIILSAAGVALLTLTPWLNPQEVSASNQFARLKAGEISAEDIDLGLFRYQLGRSGEEKLTLIKALTEEEGALSKAEATVLAQRLDVLESAKYYYDWEQKQRLAELYSKPAGVEWLNEGVADKAAFESSIEPELCREQLCFALSVDLDDDGEKEVLIADSPEYVYDLKVYATDEAGAWNQVGRLIMPSSSYYYDEDLLGVLKRGEYRLELPRYKSIHIGGTVMSFSPMRSE
ncbi:DUF4153 domain-containing protein [Hahella aquimaris]|uniref:DUF4153 domain-containing protein n=1 Tax=Hahella sp. HNIBRBA332 TaxID=3015983 RepID=UPI00273CDA6D|nr:DUF4153 domain-containing protein [Hahella sp. HNIBRBA332]WLQ12936.1 DUF4153 domain-containing protein [Hahella sp. HNIBRBA332]